MSSLVGSNASIKALTEQYCLGTYPERQIALVRGEGAHVWDADGNRYLDCLAGIGVNNLGHCHPKVVAAVQKQVETLIHVSNLYLIEPQAQLAELLCHNTFATKVFFSNSGAEAIEGALKLARKYARKKGYSNRYRFLCLENSFYGRTYGAVTATGQLKYHQDFEPMLPGFSSNSLSTSAEQACRVRPFTSMVHAPHTSSRQLQSQATGVVLWPSAVVARVATCCSTLITFWFGS